MVVWPLLVLAFLPLCSAFAEEPPSVLVASYEGAITPAAGEWLTDALLRAHRERSAALVIQLDTPGGLLESTRLLVRAIQASSVPVVVYVAPFGARAASAGVFITMAAHAAGMAPGTRIGAAHPVELGKETQPDMRAKIENDTVAFIKNIAATRGRNVQWAEEAVRSSRSSTEEEAVRLNVVDLSARDLPLLLALLDGRQVATSSGLMILRTKGAVIQEFPMSRRVKALRILSDPNIAYLLMMIGIYGILYEIWHPGVVLPGVAGAISLILGLYAFQTIPVNIAGLALMALAAVLFAIESQVPSGVIGLGGVIALALGSLFLIRGDFPEWRISRWLIAGAVAATALLISALSWLLWRLRRRKTVTGAEAMIGQVGVAKTDLDPEGQVLVGGELWNATAAGRIRAGEAVEVTALENLKLTVRRK